MVSNCIYDILLGPEKSTTIFKYEINYRNYFIVTQGSVHVKLVPPVDKSFLHIDNNYSSFEFTSPINPWDIQECYKNDFSNVKVLDIVLNVGQCFYIPPHWLYSFQFLNEKTSVSSLKYRTFFNNIVIIDYIALHFLQLINTKYIITKSKKNKKKIKDTLKDIPDKQNISIV